MVSVVIVKYVLHQALSEMWSTTALKEVCMKTRTIRDITGWHTSRPIIYLPNKGLIGKQARADVFDTIERFNNAMQRHSTLGLVSPVQFEKLAAN